jgi:MFS transporter, MHS family, proline/betaine transporter
MNNTLSAANIQTKLTKEQKEAVGLLSIGTFLEYFDLMLYVHMAVLLNDLFFPKTEPHISALLTAGTFCATYVFRPFGALLFGWIGDNFGRRYTIILTTIIMATCCATMAVCPTYAEIGITASYMMMSCRIIQGLSSMGEVVGALLYLTEFIKTPIRYYAVSMIPAFATFGGLAALGLATLATSHGANWRIAFIVGAIIAGVGMFARTSLRESPEFADAHKRLKKIEQDNNLSINEKQQKIAMNQQVNKKSSIALFCMECMWPLCFYFVFVFCSDELKSRFGYTSAQVIHHNFLISIAATVADFIRIFLCRKMHPLMILRYQLIICSFIFIVSPFWLKNTDSTLSVAIIQILVVTFAADSKFVSSSLYVHFPIFKRFRTASFLYALSRALTYVATSFGMVYLSNLIGPVGVLIGMLIVTISTAWGLNHFWQLEKNSGDLERYRTINYKSLESI